MLGVGFSLEFEWLQVSSSLQDSSQYSSWFKKCCSLDGLQSFSPFHVSSPITNPFGIFLSSPILLLLLLLSSFYSPWVFHASIIWWIFAGEWMIVSSGLKDSSQYSSRSHNNVIWGSLFFVWFTNPPFFFSRVLATVPSAPTPKAISVSMLHSFYF